MKTAEDRLADLLNDRDAEVEQLKARIAQLEQQLQSAASGWREPRSLADDMSLPVPRLELRYAPDPELGWYTVVYMLVRKHLLGHLSGIPLGSTKIEGGDGTRPGDDHLPFRDAAHAAHDGAHLGLPAYRVVDGVAKRLHFTDWPHQVSLGMQHRREERAGESTPPAAVLTASGHRLDVLGERAEVSRRPDEPDAEFRERIVAEMKARQRGGTRTSE